MKTRLLTIMCCIFLLTGCGQAAEPADSPPPQLPSISQEQLIQDVFTAFDELENGLYSDYDSFLDYVAESESAGSSFSWLRVLDEAGAPVPNILCFDAEGWALYQQDLSGRPVGLSMNSGLLPLTLGSPPAENTTLYLVNADAAEPIVQEISLTDELISHLNSEIMLITWQHPTPRETVEEAEHLTITLVGGEYDEPVADFVVTAELCDEVYFQYANDNIQTGPGPNYREPDAIPEGMYLYQPRYTDADGVTRMVIPPSLRAQLESHMRYAFIVTPTPHRYLMPDTDYIQGVNVCSAFNSEGFITEHHLYEIHWTWEGVE